MKVSMPDGAKILCVQTQGNALQLWALVDPSRPKSFREFEVVGTGCEIGEGGRRYIGTAQTYGGEFVWHVFEVIHFRSAPAEPVTAYSNN